MIIEIINPLRADVKIMIQQADELMLALYPPESNHLDDLSELTKQNVCFAGAFMNGELAGIGAVKMLLGDGAYGEIKRVYVDKQYRSKKVAQKIMEFLEGW